MASKSEAKLSNEPLGGNVLTMIEHAYKLIRTGKDQTEKGSQELGAAVMLQHETETAQGFYMLGDTKVKGPPTFFDMLEKTDRVNNYATHMLEDITRDLPPTAGKGDFRKLDKGDKSDALLVAQTQYAARKTAMRRAVVLAATLSNAGVSHAAWNGDYFMVPAKALVEKGANPAFKLATSIENDKSLPLNGNAYYVAFPAKSGEGETIRSIRASVAQVVRTWESFNKPPKEEEAPPADDRANAGQGDTGGLPIEEVIKSARAVGTTRAIAQLATAINAIVGKLEADPDSPPLSADEESGFEPNEVTELELLAENIRAMLANAKDRIEQRQREHVEREFGKPEQPAEEPKAA